MRWRPIKTAPKDEHVMLKYPSLSDDGKIYVNQGRWVQFPHENTVTQELTEGREPEYPKEGWWEVGYVAVLEIGGRWNGHAYVARSCRVKPTHWQPLPKA